MPTRSFAASPTCASRTARRKSAWFVLVLALLCGPSGKAWAQDPPELVEGKIAAGLDASRDEDIEQRLRATFSNLDLLTPVSVAVESGVVRLTGTVDTSEAKALAGQLAQQVDGVSAVENEVEENRSIERRLQLAVERLVERAWSVVDVLPLMVIAVLVILGAVIVARLAVASEAPFRWLTDNVFLRDLARQAVRLGILVAGALIALEVLDATALVGAVLGAAGVAGLAIGFAFRDLVENYIASILLSLRRPFAPRDLVQIENHLGTVARLTSRATILVTPDGNHVRIPNAVVFKATIENFTRTPLRRFSFGVGVGVDEDLVSASELGTSILEAMRGIVDDPEPFCQVDELGDSSVTLTFHGWIDQSEADYYKVRSEAIRLVKQAFDRQEIEMPEPIHRVRLETMPERQASEKSSAAPPSDEVGDIARESTVDELVDVERRENEEDLLEGGGREE